MQRRIQTMDILSVMRPYFLYSLFTSTDCDIDDLLMLGFLESMEEEDSEDLEEQSDTEDELDDEDEEGEEEEEDEDEEEEVEEEESDYDESDDDEEEEEEPIPPKRRLLNNLTSQPMGAGSSTATVIANHHAIVRTEQGNSSRPESASQRTPSTQPTVSLRISRADLDESPRPMQVLYPSERRALMESSPSPDSSPNSRSQQVQTDTPENGAPGSSVRQVSQHNMPQARVVLRLPNNIGDMYTREE